MDMNWIIRRNHLKHAYEALYHQMAAAYGLSDTEAWILYALMDAPDGLTQQDLVSVWNFPKQTIHAAIHKLERNGYVTLTSVRPGSRSKLVMLTGSGIKLADDTVRRIFMAEEAAASHLTEDERKVYLSMSEKFYHALVEETNVIRKV